MAITGSWFTILGSYSDTNGVDVIFHGKGGTSKKTTLTKQDVTYLLIGVDGHVTVGPQIPTTIAFMLYGALIQVSDEEWLEFVDALSSVAGADGWIGFPS